MMTSSSDVQFTQGSIWSLSRFGSTSVLQVLFTDIDEKIGKSTLAQYQKLYGQNNVLFIQADVTSQEQMEGL